MQPQGALKKIGNINQNAEPASAFAMDGAVPQGGLKKIGNINQKPQYQPGIGDYVRQLGQGATFNLADEAEAGVRSVFGQSYGETLEGIRASNKKFEQELPLQSLGLQLGGGLLTGGAGATTKAGMALARSLRTGNTLARVAKGAGTGAASGGMYGFGAGEGDDRLDSAGQGVLIGGLAGGAIPAAGSALSGTIKGGADALKGMGARAPDVLEQAGYAIKNRASQSYKDSRTLGATLNKGALTRAQRDIDQALLALGKNNARLHGDTLSVLNDFKKAAKGGNLSLEELDQYRQLFGDAIMKNTDGIKGPNPDAKKASKAIEAIDDLVDSLTAKDLSSGSLQAVKALNEGRVEWQKFRKFQAVSNVVKQADGDPNRLKAGLQRFVNKPKNLKGYTPDEVKALKDAARNTAGEGLLKALGKFGFDFGSSLTPGNAFLPVSSMLAGGAGVPGGVELAITGTTARQLQKLIGRGRTETALQLIESGGANPRRLPAGNVPPAALNLAPYTTVIPQGNQRGMTGNMNGIPRITITPKKP